MSVINFKEFLMDKINYVGVVIFVLLSFFLLSVSTRKFSIPLLTPENLGVGDYQVVSVIADDLNSSICIVTIRNIATDKRNKFETKADLNGGFCVKAVNPHDCLEVTKNLYLVAGEDFKVMRTNEKQGHQLAYAKWLS